MDRPHPKPRSKLNDIQLRRNQLWKKSGGRCFYCGIQTSFKVSIKDPTYFTIDHLIPKCKGGKNAQSNLVAACRACNNARGHKSVFEFAGDKEDNTLRND
jgi:5-methylcytosine-specific restriction endonuclease McrA